MKSEIIVIGDEILIGQVKDTNSVYMSRELNKTGVSVKRIHVVGDNEDEILDVLKLAERNADVILTTGGLGPTRDDKTKAVFCNFFGASLKRHVPSYRKVAEFFKERNLPMLPVNEQQADLPENCTAILNNHGTAPGMWFEKKGKIFIAMPGVPYEMKAMMKDKVLPRLRKVIKLSPVYHFTVHTVGIGESFLAERLKDIEENLPDEVKLAYLPQPGIVRLRFSTTTESGKRRIFFIHNIIKKTIGKYIFGYEDTTLEEETGKLLIKKNTSLALAESCTGGFIAAKITSVPGSSAYFSGGVVAYANRIKTGILGVPPSLLKKHGAVSESVACAMASGVRKNLHADIGISTTGIAGPSGGSKEKPVGTVWIGYADKRKTIAKKFFFAGTRDRIILQASVAALNIIRTELSQSFR